MKRLILLLVATSHFLFSQNNVSFLLSDDFSPEAKNEERIAMAITSFELVNGLAIVRASVDGEAGDFVLDTGAPGIVLNAKNHEGSPKLEGHGIGGGVDIREVRLLNFEWGMIQKADFDGLTLDISHLESACGRELMGLIGFDIFQNHEILFDYRNRLIRMYDASEAKKFRPKGTAIEVPFRLNGHIPLIPMKVGGKKVYMGLDSGAEVNLLHQPFFKKIGKSQMGGIETEAVIGLDKEQQLVKGANVKKSAIKDFEVEDMRFLFFDLSPVQSELEERLDGILGFPFFTEHTISINFKKQRVFIWE